MVQENGKGLYGDEDIHLLSGEEGTEYLSAPRRTTRKTQYRSVTTIMLLIFVLLISNLASAWLVATHNTSSRDLPPIRPGKDAITNAPNSWFGGGCGDTPVTARARGCHFNTVLYAWVEPKCLTAEDLADEDRFYAETEFPWESVEDRQPINRVEALSGEATSVLTNMEWHVQHCTYVWQRLHRALLKGTPIDSYTADYHHTMHCQEMVGDMMRNGSMSQNPTHVFAKYPSCA
jgi:hypothetical protein